MSYYGLWYGSFNKLVTVGLFNAIAENVASNCM